MLKDTAGHKSVWTIRKYKDHNAFMRGEAPYEVSSFENNMLLNEGITLLQNLLTAAGGTAYNNANAWLGVGTSSGSVSAVQTGLSGTAAYRPMEATYPQIANQTTTWRSVFAGDQGNFQWQEFTVANGSGNASTNLNRRVSDQGIKASGTTWTLDLSITWS